MPHEPHSPADQFARTARAGVAPPEPHVALDELDAGAAEPDAGAALPDPVVPMLEMTREPYLVTSALGVIRLSNEAAAALLGIPTWRLRGRPLALHVAPVARQEFRTTLNRLARCLTPVNDWALPLVSRTGAALTASAAARAARDPGTGDVLLHWILHRAEPETESPALPLFGRGDPNERRLRTLAQVGALIGASLDGERLLPRVARATLPILGDWCLVDLLDDAGQETRRVLALHSFVPGGTADAEALLAVRYCLDALAGPVSLVLRHGEPQSATHLEAADLAPLAHGDAELALLRRLRPASWLMVPISVGGRVLGAMTWLTTVSCRHHSPGDQALARDIAVRVGGALEMARLYRAAREASEAKSNFLSVMSHELRTPLTAVTGYAELLADGIVGPVTERQREHLQRILAGSAHLLQLVDEILTFARLEATNERAVAADADLGTVLREAEAVIAPLLLGREVRLVVDVPPPPLPIRTDALRLRQIVINLLGNAAKFTEHGEIGIRATPDERTIELVAWDTGVGIAPGDLSRVFDAFWQAGNPFTSRARGTGLGLAVVRRLARLLGGSVTAQSTPGEGSRFTVRIPRELPEDAAPAPPSPGVLR